MKAVGRSRWAWQAALARAVWPGFEPVVWMRRVGAAVGRLHGELARAALEAKR